MAREDRCEGEDAGSHTLPRTGVELLKIALFKGEQGSPIALAPPFHKALLNPEDTLPRTAAFGPCPPSVVGSQPRVSCSQAGQDKQPEVSTL